jgi:hypothetical protein
LQSAEARAIERKESFECDLEIGITLYNVQDLGKLLEFARLLKIERSSSKALEGKYCNISGEIPSILAAADFRDKIAVLSSLRVNG